MTLNVRAEKKLVTTKLEKVAESGKGDTKPIIAELEKALDARLKENLGDTPHVRGVIEKKLDPYVVGIENVVDGKLPLIRKAVAELVLDLTKQGAKVKTQIDPIATDTAAWVSITVDMNDVR